MKLPKLPKLPKLLILMAIAGLLAYGIILAAGLRQPGNGMPNVIEHSDTKLVKAATGAQGAVDITGTRMPGDDRLFIATQDGRILISQKDGGDASGDVFLDISDRVTTGANEQGLLGLVFDPGYEDNGYFYVNYTAKEARGTYNGEDITAGDTLVSRFTRSSTAQDKADPDSELVILGFKQPEANHNGGGLAFGPDGMLYIASGDGGGGGDRHARPCAYGNGQCPSTYLGKILRIDVRKATANQRYQVPRDNPFVSDPSAKPEIWHTGLRNPWRFSFDRQTGDMLIGDVGQGEREEIDLAKAGQKGLNFGWRCFEGSQAFSAAANPACADESNFVRPVYENDHSEGRCSITGGYVYRGEFSGSFRGMYVFSDYCSSRIYYLSRPSEGPWKVAETIETGFPEKSVSSLGEDNQGEPYVALLTGDVYRIEVPR